MTGPRTITLIEIAAELNLNVSGVARKAKKLGLTIRRQDTFSRRCRALVLKDAAILRDSYALHVTAEQAEGWVTLETAARMLGISRSTFVLQRSRGRLKLTPRQIVGQAGGGRVTRYPIEEVRRLAASVPVRPRTVPRGSLALPEMVRVSGVKACTLVKWAGQGMPHGLLLSGRRYYRPAEVLAWLEALPIPRTSRKADLELRRAACRELQMFVNQERKEAA